MEPLTFDAAHLHAAALGTKMYIRLTFGCESHGATGGTAIHFGEALRILRERLSSSDESKKTSDSTMLVVIVLALYARTVGDYSSAKNHMEGLRKMTELRGGVASITARTMLAMEVFR